MPRPRLFRGFKVSPSSVTQASSPASSGGVPPREATPQRTLAGEIGEALPFTAVRALKFLLPLFLAWPGLSAQAAAAKVLKVLPQFLDRQGRHAVSPSLFDRDAYQAQLRRRPEERSGLRFAINWKAPASAQRKLRVELLGARGPESTKALLEGPVQRHGLFGTWSSLALTGESYKSFGELVAWRVSLWDGPTQVAEQKSFLWPGGK